MSIFNFPSEEALYANKDVGALACASKTLNDMPDLVKDIIADYTTALYVTDQRKHNLAQRADMCADLVKAKILDEIGAAQEDLSYTRIWYENEVRDTEHMYYENKGRATDELIEAAMKTRQHLEDGRYQDYLRKANHYNNILDKNKELLNTISYNWDYRKEIIEGRAQDRIYIAQELIAQREIADGLWGPTGFSEDKDTLSHQPDVPMDPDEPAIGSDCWGCAENQPNQEAHMGPGGCLHMPFESEAEEDFAGPYHTLF